MKVLVCVVLFTLVSARSPLTIVSTLKAVALCHSVKTVPVMVVVLCSIMYGVVLQLTM